MKGRGAKVGGGGGGNGDERREGGREGNVANKYIPENGRKTKNTNVVKLNTAVGTPIHERP